MTQLWLLICINTGIIWILWNHRLNDNKDKTDKYELTTTNNRIFTTSPNWNSENYKFQFENNERKQLWRTSDIVTKHYATNWKPFVIFRQIILESYLSLQNVTNDVNKAVLLIYNKFSNANCRNRLIIRRHCTLCPKTQRNFHWPLHGFTSPTIPLEKFIPHVTRPPPKRQKEL